MLRSKKRPKMSTAAVFTDRVANTWSPPRLQPAFGLRSVEIKMLRRDQSGSVRTRERSDSRCAADCEGPNPSAEVIVCGSVCV